MYYNLAVNVDFEENSLTYCIYQPNDSPQMVESGMIQQRYEDNFSLDNFLKKLLQVLNNDARLSKKVLYKKRGYNKYWILKLSVVFVAILAFLVLIICASVRKVPINLGIWGYIGLALIIAIYIILDYLQKK